MEHCLHRPGGAHQAIFSPHCYAACTGLAERTKQAGSAAFKMGKFEQAIKLYTEALLAAETLARDGDLKVNTRPNPNPNTGARWRPQGEHAS